MSLPRAAAPPSRAWRRFHAGTLAVDVAVAVLSVPLAIILIVSDEASSTDSFDGWGTLFGLAVLVVAGLVLALCAAAWAASRQVGGGGRRIVHLLVVAPLATLHLVVASIGVDAARTAGPWALLAPALVVGAVGLVGHPLLAARSWWSARERRLT